MWWTRVLEYSAAVRSNISEVHRPTGRDVANILSHLKKKRTQFLCTLKYCTRYNTQPTTRVKMNENIPSTFERPPKGVKEKGMRIQGNEQ